MVIKPVMTLLHLAQLVLWTYLMLRRLQCNKAQGAVQTWVCSVCIILTFLNLFMPSQLQKDGLIISTYLLLWTMLLCGTSLLTVKFYCIGLSMMKRAISYRSINGMNNLPSLCQLVIFGVKSCKWHMIMANRAYSMRIMPITEILHGM